eukprot:350311-Pleurochrysis_carterae.AAC.1
MGRLRTGSLVTMRPVHLCPPALRSPFKRPPRSNSRIKWSAGMRVNLAWLPRGVDACACECTRTPLHARTTAYLLARLAANIEELMHRRSAQDVLYQRKI